MIINVLQGRKLKEMCYYPHFTEKKNYIEVKEIYCSVKPNYLPRLVDRKTGI